MRHILDREFFRCHQGISASQRCRLCPVQTLAGHLGANGGLATHSLLPAVGAPLALARNCLLQPDVMILLLLPSARVVELDHLIGGRDASEEGFHPPVIGHSSIGLARALGKSDCNRQQQRPEVIAVQDVTGANIAALKGLATGADLAHTRQA